MLPVTETLSVGSVVLAPGFDEFQASLRGEFGHGRYANVLTSVQFEGLLSAAGPTGGGTTGFRTPGIGPIIVIEAPFPF